MGVYLKAVDFMGFDSMWGHHLGSSGRNATGGCHSHRLYSHSCDLSQRLMVKPSE